MRYTHTHLAKLLLATCLSINLYISSGLDRSSFDNKAVSFEEHLKSEHCMWHYLFFIVLVKVKDPTEFTGPESYVYAMVKVRILYNIYTSISIVQCKFYWVII